MREKIENTKKLDNKGFSLIELIIVIAIMAILIGIVGSQVVPYIEKSKQAKDQQVISSLLTSATTAYSSNAEVADKAGATSFTIGAALTGDAKAISDEFYELSDLGDSGQLAKLKGKMTSKAADKITSITIARDTNGVITVKTVVSDTKYAKVFTTLSST